MHTTPNLLKPLKRYLRNTWVYSAKTWIDRQRPASVQQRRKMATFYRQFVQPGDVCFDVGANVGNRTEIFLELGATVIAVEPQAVCLETLQQRFGTIDRVHLVDQALGEAEGVAEMSICEDANTISTLSSQWKTSGRFVGEFEWTKTQTVTVTTLDRLIDRYGIPQFCKIDVEGFELPVLKGLTQPIRALSFEFNLEFANDTEACLQHLRSIGAIELNYSIGESMEWGLTAWLSPEDFMRHLETVRDPLFWCDVYVRFV